MDFPSNVPEAPPQINALGRTIIIVMFLCGLVGGWALQGHGLSGRFSAALIPARPAAGAFADVPDDHWAKEAIHWVTAAGIMKGNEEKSRFLPEGTVRRAELATALERLHERVALETSSLQECATSVNARLTSLEQARSFSMFLDGAQQKPGIETKMKGAGYFLLLPQGLWYSLSVRHPSSKIIVGHLHRKPTEVQADPNAGDEVLEEMLFSGNVTSGLIPLTARDRSDLLLGNLYVNVHTLNFPKGEISGEFLPAYENVQ